MIPEELTICLSSYGPMDTMDRFAAAVTDHGMTILSRIDHASGAGTVGMELRPTEILIFGNPRAGSPLGAATDALAAIGKEAAIRPEGAAS